MGDTEQAQRDLARMCAIVDQSTSELTNLELNAVNLVVMLDSDPRTRSWYDAVGHLWDTKDASGRPKMNDLTKQALAIVANKRLGF